MDTASIAGVRRRACCAYTTAREAPEKHTSLQERACGRNVRFDRLRCAEQEENVI